MRKFLTAIAISVMMSGCTSQQMAKEWGTSTTINLPCNRKLINVTYDEKHDIWFLTREMYPEDTAEKYTLQESSAWGILQGTINLAECKK